MSAAFLAFLADTAKASSFFFFLLSEHSHENLLFHEEVLAYKTHPTRARAQSIFTRYVAIDSPHELNISSTLRKKLEALFNDAEPEVGPEVFDAADASVLELMEMDSYRRFSQGARNTLGGTQMMNNGGRGWEMRVSQAKPLDTLVH